ncbi:MAG TPA: NAD(P)H-hydrate epimerase, partial [Methylomirabilota bacterium]|nr:NAD(P)H-hydrate epimerase [Methylomirabilota bacterium]
MTDDFGLTLLDPAEMALADRLTADGGISGLTLMDSAGYAVADDICARHRQGTRVAVLCGPGNNGGDGFVAARVLAERGFVVRLGLLGERQRLTGDAAAAAARFRGTVEPAAPPVLHLADVIVDALFGAGLARDLDGRAADLVEAINVAGAAGASVVAVDLPSGIDGRTGEIRGVAVRARRSVTFFRRKPGHLLMPGRARAGRVVVADIGIRPAVLRSIGARAFANEPPLWRASWPAAAIASHNYARGAVLVASGPIHSSGAARLAAAAALHAGAGIVFVACPPDAVPVVAAYRAAFVVKPTPDEAAYGEVVGERRLGAIVVGPGLGTDERGAGIVRMSLEGAAALVLDADGLTLASREPRLMEALRSRAAPTVLTPHEGEFARLFPDVSGSKLDRVRAAAGSTGA